MIFGKYINRYYLRHAPALLLGILALLMVDYIQLLVPQLYRLVINGVNLGQVVVRGETMPFTKEVLFQHICLPMIWIVLFMVVGRFLWRICFFGTSIRVQADLREKMFDHSRRLSQQYYQVNKVGNLMSLYTNDLDTIQECFGDGILMFFDALVLGLLALYRMWCMDRRMTMLALIPAAFMFAIGTVMGKTMTKRGRSASRRSRTCPTLRRRTSPASRSSRRLSRSSKSSSRSANSTKTTKKSTWSIPASQYCSK